MSHYDYLKAYHINFVQFFHHVSPTAQLGGAVIKLKILDAPAIGKRHNT
jgi:hypothetical protein